MPKTVNLDAPSITQDEAVEIVIHHLRMAHCIFEATPDDGAVVLTEEINRIIKERDGPGAAFIAAQWAVAMTEMYEKMKEFD